MNEQGRTPESKLNCYNNFFSDEMINQVINIVAFFVNKVIRNVSDPLWNKLLYLVDRSYNVVVVSILLSFAVLYKTFAKRCLFKQLVFRVSKVNMYFRKQRRIQIQLNCTAHDVFDLVFFYTAKYMYSLSRPEKKSTVIKLRVTAVLFQKYTCKKRKEALATWNLFHIRQPKHMKILNCHRVLSLVTSVL